MDVSQLPFNQWLGLSVCDDTICLLPQPQHLNHVETVHAAVIFGMAEAAAGHWLSLRYPELEKSHVALLRQSNVKYRHPAIAGVQLIGSATCDEATAAGFLTTLQERGRAVLEISAAVHQADNRILQATFGWFASQRAKH